jgi:RNA polymerase sigma-70 factor (ECF subfamily)
MAQANDQSPEPAPAVSDEQLLLHYTRGDVDAFEQLVRRYRRQLFNFLARFVGDRALAEDVFQETFLQVHLSAEGFDVSRRLKPWLFTIAANKARDAMRSRRRRQAVSLDAPVAGNQDERTTYADLMPADVPAPSESLMNLETRQAVHNIIRQMPEAQRLVLLLSYFHELPYKEIAETLGVPLGTVKSRLHAAVKHFAKQWKTAAKKLHHDRPETR